MFELFTSVAAYRHLNPIKLVLYAKSCHQSVHQAIWITLKLGKWAQNKTVPALSILYTLLITVPDPFMFDINVYLETQILGTREVLNQLETSENQCYKELNQYQEGFNIL